jgi:NAD(P)-dependent dehydrogenase (short-subunit alcohol dehydrogenase family)
MGRSPCFQDEPPHAYASARYGASGLLFSLSPPAGKGDVRAGWRCVDHDNPGTAIYVAADQAGAFPVRPATEKSPMLLSGKVAIVTGAAQGIGQACAVRLAKEGAKVIVCDVNDKAGERTAKSIESKGGTATYVHCDVSKVADVARALKATLDAYKRVDILVNTAGVVDDAPFLELPLEELDRVLSINLRGAFVMAQAAAQQMVSQGKGKGGKSAGAIVNMSSINERFGLPDHVAYSMSKGGISQLTKAMAVALAPHGIRVNAVGPGTIDTPLLKDVVKDTAFRTKVLSRTPLGRFGRPEEIAAIVAWLASDESSYVTGTTVFADGGRLPLNYVVPVEGE